MLGAFKFQLASRGPPIGAAGQLNLPTPSWTLESVWEGAPDYPRVCGATQVRGHAQAQAVGLSPRVRGNHVVGDVSPGYDGSIPACAGQPTFVAGRAIIVQRRVYPRVCGATIVDLRGSYDAIGLSPRVRGNPLSGTGQSRSLWSIPACAGQPGRPLPASLRRWVYPRVCGATSINPPSTKALVGLSPRVRGNLLDGPIKPKRGGSIPACAGQPIVLPTYGHSHEVYPRVCGATRLRFCFHHSLHGLSPRVRGNRDT